MENQSNTMPLIICVSSGKGGVGKTSFSVNLAAAMAGFGKNILLIDGDLGLANVDIVLGLNVNHTLQEVVEEGRDPFSMLVQIKDNFFVLPASSGVPEMANLSHEDQLLLTNTLEDMITNFDYVIVDTAAGLGESVLWFNTWAHENIVILSADPTSMTDAYALIKVLNTRRGKDRFHLVVNNVKNRKESQGVFSSLSAVLGKFLDIKPVFLGVVPHDACVAKAIRRQQPFLYATPDCKAATAVTEIASAIING